MFCYPESGITPVAQTNLLVLGRVVAPRGVDGELKIDLEANNAAWIGSLQRVYLGEERLLHTVRRARLHQGQGLLLLEQITDRDAAERWRGAWVYIAAEDVPVLGQDEYRVDSILGLRVVTVEGEELGVVSEIIATRANDVYAVRGPQGDILLPAVKQVIVAVDLGAGVMTVKLLDGMRQP